MDPVLNKPLERRGDRDHRVLTGYATVRNRGFFCLFLFYFVIDLFKGPYLLEKEPEMCTVQIRRVPWAFAVPFSLLS